MHGKILWWDKDGGCGVVVDDQGNRIYFDQSVVQNRDIKKLKKDVLISFRINTAVRNCLAAKDIEILSASKLKNIKSALSRTSTIKDVA